MKIVTRVIWNRRERIQNRRERLADFNLHCGHRRITSIHSVKSQSCANDSHSIMTARQMWSF